MQMGWTSASLGLVFHFTIAFTAAAVYYLTSRVLRVLVERAILCGLIYGELVFLFMYFVVLPFSALGPAHFTIATYITGPLATRFWWGCPSRFPFGVLQSKCQSDPSFASFAKGRAALATRRARCIVPLRGKTAGIFQFWAAAIV
jgi:hypothetical protein